MVSVKHIKTWLVVTIILIVGYSFTDLFKRLEVKLTTANEGHTEIMLWNYTKTSFDSRLNLQFDVKPNRESIDITYRITNLSDETIATNNTVDFALVEAKERNAGDPGKAVWFLSESGDRDGLEPINIQPHGVFRDRIRIDRQEIGFHNGQYYINGYFAGEFVAQYKIIEGLLK